ncbi:MAG: hypothetical protein WA151_04385, partial [Desulfatirhabdiaceae bacterium]
MKLKRCVFVMACAVMFLISDIANAQPQSPVLSVTNGGWTYLSWTEVAGATGYTLSFAPMTYTGLSSIVKMKKILHQYLGLTPIGFTYPMTSIVSVDMGTQKSVSGELPAGAAFYVRVQSRDNTGVSQYSNLVSVIIGSYPIAADVFTTVQKTIVPVALPSDTPQISPADLFLYDVFGYSAWQEESGLVASKQTDIMPTGYAGASVTNQARLLNFIAMTDIHIADKESPAQGNYFGWSAAFGADALGANHSSAYS